MKKAKPLTRFISFRFDDGFIEGAKKAAVCLGSSRASYFIVAGLTRGQIHDGVEPLFRGRNFGTIDEWRAISKLGHDVQLHGSTHHNLAAMSHDQRLIEVNDSLSLVQGIHNGPYVFCYPFNAMTDLYMAPLGIAAAGFNTDSSDNPLLFNKLSDNFDLYSLKSWAVRERHFDFVVNQLNHLPDDSWTILAFHSLDGEGHEPWATETFIRLIKAVRATGAEIVTVGDMVTRILTGSKSGSSVATRIGRAIDCVD